MDSTKTVCHLRVNGDAHTCAVTPGTTLLEALRYVLSLTGSKQGCDKGDCGACTVLIDGHPVLACITLALACEGREIRTVEGLAAQGRPHPLQDAFDRTGGAHERHRAAGARSRAHARSDGPGAERQPVPLHGLHQDL
jgi:aerobic-type carbon monoxide dehydrogenase small subunit (CoxS/CutS family)